MAAAAAVNFLRRSSSSSSFRLLRSRRTSMTTTFFQRRKWSRGRKVLVAALTIGGAGITYARQVPDLLGPIYQFEEEDGGSLVSSSSTTATAAAASSNGDRLPLEYDIEAIDRYWEKRPFEVLSRTTEVMLKLVPYLGKVIVWEYLVRRKIRDHDGLQRKYAVRVREILTELGPCFIKLGQMLSIRPDLLPNTFLIELQRLCDSVPSFPTEDAIRVIQSELGIADARTLFADLSASTGPIAAASLGQVYKVSLAPDGGRKVAVKVQRPDMLRSVLKDLYILRKIAIVLEYVKSIVTNQRPYYVSILDTFARSSLKELDYVNEAQNQERFIRELVPKLGANRIHIPKVYHEYTTRKVLVTEWIEGKQLAKSSDDVINRLTQTGVECFMVQLLETGYFHADPHPGNLLVTEDGKLALIDFGLCETVPIPDTKKITLALVHLMQGDVSGLIGDFISLGFLPEGMNIDELEPELQRIYDNAQGVESTANSNFKAVAHRRKKFMAVSYDLNKVFFKYPFLVPDYFALMTRAMVVLEGIAVTGNPDFDLFNTAYPYAVRVAVNRFGISDLTLIAKEAIKLKMS